MPNVERQACNTDMRKTRPLAEFHRRLRTAARRGFETIIDFPCGYLNKRQCTAKQADYGTQIVSRSSPVIQDSFGCIVTQASTMIKCNECILEVGNDNTAICDGVTEQSGEHRAYSYIC